jgi:hypothetical protein
VTGLDVFNRDPDRAAEALRLEWGETYDIGFADGAWQAARSDGTGQLLTGQVPDELVATIRADWGARNARGTR